MSTVHLYAHRSCTVPLQACSCPPKYRVVGKSAPSKDYIMIVKIELDVMFVFVVLNVASM